MKIPAAVLVLLGLVIPAVACGPAADQEPVADEAEMPSAEEGIAAASAAWAAAWDAGDGSAIAALYTEDAMVLPPGGEAVEGRAAIAAYWQGFIDSVAGSDVTLETLEVHSGDGGAIEVGSFMVTGADGEHVDHGKYIVNWKLVDGTWMLHRDIFNSSMAGE